MDDLEQEPAWLRDESGAPLCLYHGTSETFAHFDVDNQLHWFTDDRDAAFCYGWPNYNLIEVHLVMANPARDSDVFAAAESIGVDQSEIDDEYGAKVLELQDVAERLIEQGFDGAIVSDMSEDGKHDIASYVVFHPSQITTLSMLDVDGHLIDHTALVEPSLGSRSSGLRM